MRPVPPAPPFIPSTLALAALTATLLGAAPARAQQDSSQVAAARTDSAVTLPAIQVTGTARPAATNRLEQGYLVKRSAVSGFREQDVLDTPFSSSSFSAELMLDQQARTVTDVVKNDPSVSTASDPMWYDRVNVRGFYLGVDAVYRNGLGINDQGSIALENKAAVEIHKGLSALRYGATSPGGTLNYVVKRPTREDLRVVHVMTDEHGSAGLHADLGGRLGEQRQFGYRINVAGERQRNHVDAFQGRKGFGSAFFDWQVNDRLLLEVDFEHQKLDKRNVSSSSLWWWSSTEAARAAFGRLQPDTYVSQPWADEPNRQTYAGARAQLQLTPGWKASLAVQHSRLHRDQNAGDVGRVLNDAGDYEAMIYYSPDQERNNEAYQFVVEGDLRWGAVRHELALGADAIQRDMTWPEGVYTVIGADNLFNPRGVARPAVGPAEAGPSFLRGRTRQRSLFVTDTLVIDPHWRLFAGLRHTALRQYAKSDADAPVLKEYDESALNPTLGVIFKPTAGSTLYASYAEGIEQGGVVSGGQYSNDGEVFEPLRSKQLEFGLKWELGADALLTAAVFQIDKGLETDRRNADNTLTRVQDGRQVHKGVEVTLAGRLTKDLRVVAGAAHLNAKVSETSDAALRGKRPQGVPDWQANLHVQHRLDAVLSGLSVHGGLHYGGRKAIDELNTWMAPSFVRADAGVKYEHRLPSGGQATWRLNVDNLADKRYLANTTWGALQFGAPRTVRVSASLGF